MRYSGNIMRGKARGAVGLFSTGFLGAASAQSSYSGVVKASTVRKISATTCRVPTQPGISSLLVVLLDRSGSLTSTDPDEYSASMTKALADLWPGSMAVIPFTGDVFPLPQLPK